MRESFKSHQTDSLYICVLIIETLDEAIYHIDRHCHPIDYCHCYFRKIIKKRETMRNKNMEIPSL